MANHRKMVFYTKELRDLVDRLKEIGYEVDPSLVIDPADFDNSMKDVVVIISGQGKSLFKTINNIANNELESIVFDQDDVIVVASPVVPGVENEFKSMENDMYKKEGEIIVLDKNVLSMHPSKEDLKNVNLPYKTKILYSNQRGISSVAYEFTDCG